MKPFINLAVAMLLSCVLVACGGNGGSAGSSNDNTDRRAINDLDKEPTYIDITDVNKTTFTANKGDTIYIADGIFTVLKITADEGEHGIANVIKPENRTPASSYDTAILDATYRGFLVFDGLGGENKFDSRSVVFNLKDKWITGHSVKTSEKDIQVVFQPAKIYDPKEKADNQIKNIGFTGYINVIRDGVTNGDHINQHNIYTGEFLGKNGEEISGTISEAASESGLSGAFIARKDQKVFIKDKKTP